MRKEDADRLLQSLPREANFDARPAWIKNDLDWQVEKDRQGGYIAAQMRADAEEARRHDDPMYGYKSQPAPAPDFLQRIAMQLAELSIKEFTRFKQEVGDKVAERILLWSLKRCQMQITQNREPLISMAALSAAIMPSGSENPLN